MKNVLFFMMLLGVLASCSDNNVKDLESSKVEIEQISQKKSSASLEPEVKISCNGDCGSGLPVCGVRYGGGEFWCDCDVNCSMTVEGASIKYISGGLQNTMNHVISVIGEEEMKSRSIRGIEIGFDRERNIEVVWLEMIGKDKEIYTSAILLTYDIAKNNTLNPSLSTGIEVDCSGGCSGALSQGDRGCVEVYNAGSGEIYCGCTGDGCKMVINK